MSMIVRNLQPDDIIPFSKLARGGIPLGFESLPLDPEWTWVAVDEQNRIQGILITGTASLLLILIRIAAVPEAPPLTPMLLCRCAFSDARRRGLLGYLTFLSDSAAAEVQLMRINQRHSGPKSLLPTSGAWAFGRFD